MNIQKDNKLPVISRGITVKYCKQYLYLGSSITDDSDYKSAIEADISIRNPDLPFLMKKCVTKACVFSSILYRCECDDFGRLNSIHISVVKGLLGVCKSTRNNICLVESDFPSLRSAVPIKRQKYLKKKLGALTNNDPLYKELQLARQANAQSS